MIQVALIGYGKMGKIIDQVIQQEYAGKMEVLYRIDKNNAYLLTPETLSKADVAIEFTDPDVAVKNIMHCFDAQVPVVVGTTGWYHRLEEVKAICIERNQTLFYASNFSVGVNLFFRLSRFLAQQMHHRYDYQVRLTEIHHTEKKDAPSGTAITLAETILQELSRYTTWVNHEASLPNELPVLSLREPNVPGTHIIQYYSDIDTIEIKHTAHSRLGFARGAVMAALFVIGRTGIYGMDDLLHT